MLRLNTHKLKLKLALLKSIKVHFIVKKCYCFLNYKCWVALQREFVLERPLQSEHIPNHVEVLENA